LAGPFDLVVSNPPYVLQGEELLPELTYEPRVALIDEGQTSALAAAAREVLHGWLVLEVHEDRATDVVAALTELGYTGATITRDLAGKDRVVEAQWPTTSSKR
jgi:release factor glutamine methyltransferase